MFIYQRVSNCNGNATGTPGTHLKQVYSAAVNALARSVQWRAALQVFQDLTEEATLKRFELDITVMGFYMGVSENSVSLNPMVNDRYPISWEFDVR